MGVPKFYRWLSERYPLINQLISGTVVLPEFDNLYLDMNGIIHACTHPNDNHAANSLTLREMMLAIFRYIDRIVTEIVKPKKLLFLAIDGVAPRAKLNQQRARRFRAAQDRAESIMKAKQRGDVVDEEALFDSNSITPGTEFMEIVNRHIKWFIRKKMKEDPLWAGLEVIYSGHDVPGEGEHKIMTYIRDLRASPKYEPNLRHCMYGQDADLIMLALATHEPHFALLREVINFNFNKGRKSAREVVMKQTQEASFQLLHISLLREYIALDFGHSLEVPMDHERIVDDFIFMTFLVGNDFLPHLPTLDISEHAFDVLINAYRELWAERAGYLVENGEIRDLHRLERLFAAIGVQEADILAKRELENKEYKDRMRRRSQPAHYVNEDEEDEDAQKELQLQEAFEAALREAMGKTYGVAETKQSSEEEDDDSPHGLQGEKAAASAQPESKKDYRGRYYYEKFQVIAHSAKGAEHLRGVMRHYLKGLMWCLAYYVKGCISWTWYYPFHYGPMLQDMVHLDELVNSIDFSLGEPFTPYQQLLGCLPPASANLLPRCYQALMLSSESPVADFYPADFGIDMDGKKNPWEAVVLLDFIDENRLRAAEEAQCQSAKLTSSEAQRNQFGGLLHYSYEPTAMETVLSCNPEIGLPDILHCQTRVVIRPFSLSPGEYFKSVLMEGTEYPIAGYPSLSALPLLGVEVESIKLNVFGADSRYKTVVIATQVPDMSAQNIGLPTLEKLLGRSVFINFPHMHEARVLGVTTPTHTLQWVPNSTGSGGTTNTIAHDELSSDKWKTLASKEETAYLKGRSVPGTGGLAIGNIDIRLQCAPLVGMKRNSSTGASVKVFGKEVADVPVQLALWAPICTDSRFVETESMSVAELFPCDVKVVAVKGPLRGCTGVVVGPHSHDMVAHNSRKSAFSAGSVAATAKRVVDVEFSIPQPAPAFGHSIAASVQEQYFGTREVCEMLQISPSLLGKIVGSVIVDPGRNDLGLNLKRNGLYHLNGYVRKVELASGANGADAKSGASKGNASHASKVIGVPIQSRSAWTSVDSIDVIGMVSGAAADDAHSSAEGVRWEYSVKAVMLIAEYMAKFPCIFHQLSSLPHQPFYQVRDLFPSYSPPRNPKELSKEVEAVMRWMQEQPFFHLPRTPFTTRSLPREAMAAIERAADLHTVLAQTSGMHKITVRGIALEHLFCALHRKASDVALPYNNLQPALGDRVVNLSCMGVPIGLRGTVVASHQNAKFVDVIFDEEFIGGKSLQGQCSQFRGRLCAWSDLLLLQSSTVVTQPGPHPASSAASHSTEHAASSYSSAAAAAAPRKGKKAEASKTTAPKAPVLKEDLDVEVQYEDDYDDTLDELFQSPDLPLLLATMAKQTSTGVSGLAKLAELAGVTPVHMVAPAMLAIAPALPVAVSHGGNQRHGSHTKPGTTAVSATAVLKQALLISKTPSDAAAAPQHAAPKKEAARDHDKAGKSVLDKSAAERMLKHQLGVHGAKVKPAAETAKPVSSATGSANKGQQLLHMLKRSPAAATTTTAAAATEEAPATEESEKPAPRTVIVVPMPASVSAAKKASPTAPSAPAATPGTGNAKQKDLTSLLRNAKASLSARMSASAASAYPGTAAAANATSAAPSATSAPPTATTDAADAAAVPTTSPRHHTSSLPRVPSHIVPPAPPAVTAAAVMPPPPPPSGSATSPASSPRRHVSTLPRVPSHIVPPTPAAAPSSPNAHGRSQSNFTRLLSKAAASLESRHKSDPSSGATTATTTAVATAAEEEETPSNGDKVTEVQQALQDMTVSTASPAAHTSGVQSTSMAGHRKGSEKPKKPSTQTPSAPPVPEKPKRAVAVTSLRPSHIVKKKTT